MPILESLAAAALGRVAATAMDRAVDIAVAQLREYLATQAGAREEAGRQLLARLDLERIAFAWAVEVLASPDRDRAARLGVRVPGSPAPGDFQPAPVPAADAGGPPGPGHV